VTAAVESSAGRRGTSPNFFIIGAARSGTTALAEILRHHPDAFVTNPKEPSFLAFSGEKVAFTGPGDDVSINRVAVTDSDNYLSLYHSADGKTCRGDASVSTLYYADRSVPTLQRYFPEAKLVVILRDPAARAFSAYSYQRARGLEPCEDFRQALDSEADRIRRGWHHIWHYAGMGRYAAQLAPFLETFGTERVRILFYEELNRDPVGVGGSLFRFLGLDPTVAVELEPVNVSGQPRSRLLQGAIQWAGRRHWLRSTTKAIMPFEFRERVRRANLRPSLMPDDAFEELQQVLASEADELRALLSRHQPESLSSAPPWLTALGSATEGARP
jgi:Sulfotransferase domain